MPVPRESGESGVNHSIEAYNYDANLLRSVSSIDLRYCAAALKWRHLTSMWTVHSWKESSQLGRGKELTRDSLTVGNAPQRGVTASRIADRALS